MAAGSDSCCEVHGGGCFAHASFLIDDCYFSHTNPMLKNRRLKKTQTPFFQPIPSRNATANPPRWPIGGLLADLPVWATLASLP